MVRREFAIPSLKPDFAPEKCLGGRQFRQNQANIEELARRLDKGRRKKPLM